MAAHDDCGWDSGCLNINNYWWGSADLRTCQAVNTTGVEPETDAPVETSTSTESGASASLSTEEGSTERPEVVITWTVTVTTTFSDISVTDWTDSTEELFVSGLAVSLDVASTRVTVLSVEEGSVIVSTEISDFSTLAQAEAVAEIEVDEYVLDESLGAVSISVSTPQEVSSNSSSSEQSSVNTDSDYDTWLDFLDGADNVRAYDVLTCLSVTGIAYLCSLY